MDLAKAALIWRVKLRYVLSVAAVAASAVTAHGRSCIVNAGTETYVRSSAQSGSVSTDMSSRAVSAWTVGEAVEPRSRTAGVSAGRGLLTTQPGSILCIR